MRQNCDKRQLLPKLQRVFAENEEAKKGKEGQKMTIEECKQVIVQRTGVPETLLTGETIEEDIAQAKAILAFKREIDAQRPKPTNEQFGQWVSACMGIEEQDEASQALAQIEEEARLDAGGYPNLADGGTVSIYGGNYGDQRPTREQFSEWISKNS